LQLLSPLAGGVFIIMIDKRNTIQKEERAVLVGLVNKDQTETRVQEYLDELAFLAETAGAVAVKRFTQKLPHPDSRTFVGKGKLEEIKKYVDGKNIRIVIFDDELSGAQINNIEKAIDVKSLTGPILFSTFLHEGQKPHRPRHR
jgi:GTP-binding protein HflX